MTGNDRTANLTIARMDARAKDAQPEMLREIIDAISDGLALFDNEARLVRCNTAFCELNPAIADLVDPGLPWEMILRELAVRGAMTDKTIDRLRAMEMRLADDPDASASMEIEMPNGSFQLLALAPTRNGGFLLTQSDISKRRKYEENLRDADALLRKVLEACPAAVLMSRLADGHIIYRSPAATELLGVCENSIRHWASRDERADVVTALLPDGRVDNVMITALSTDGRSFPCALSARVIDYRGEDVIVSTIVDMTRDVAIQRELAEQREQIYQSEKMSALGELLAGVAHELNNPLSVVVGHALMMREETSDPDLLRRLEKISDSSERCARIVKSFLAMARQQPANLAPTAFRGVADTAVQALCHGASGLSINIKVEIPGDLPPINADADQLVQVLINLITNAEQAITASGQGNRVKIKAKLDGSGKKVEIRVIDNGPGVPDKIRGRIFNPLFTTKDAGKGTGIGLAFCLRVVTAHEGTLRVQPTRGGGATFVMRLPVAPDAPRPETADDKSRESSEGARILVVDDEPDVAEFICEVLRKDGFTVDHSDSAEEGLRLVRNQNYALILSDLNMPGMGGRGLYEAIRGDKPRLAGRIGFVTGDTMSQSARGFLERAGRPYLEKPIAPAELRELVRNMLEQVEGRGNTA